jgi:hypothetical protein
VLDEMSSGEPRLDGDGLAVYGHARIEGCEISGYDSGISSQMGLPVVSGCHIFDCDAGIAFITEDPADTPLTTFSIGIDTPETTRQKGDRSRALPDPEDQVIQEAFKQGDFKEFERHSRVGMLKEEDFYARVEELKAEGAKHVFLKTGAYRPMDLALAVKCCSEAKLIC